jgi:hypothetical protein
MHLWKLNFVKVVLTVLMCLGMAVTAFANVTLDMQADKSAVEQNGNPVNVQVAVNNDGPDVLVDVHIALIPPNGSLIYEWPDWNTNLTPALSGFVWPANTDLPLTDLLTLQPNQKMPFEQTGTYTLLFAFLDPATFELVGNLASTTFELTPEGGGETGVVENADAVGGVYLGQSTRHSGGTVTEVTAGGTFLTDLQEVPSGEFLETDLQTLGLDTCRVSSFSIDFSTGMQLNLPTFLDAGSSIGLSAPGQSYSIPRTKDSISEIATDLIIYATDTGTHPAYQGGADYTFSGSGGPDVGPFSVTITAPPSLQLMQPDLNTLTEINTDQDLILKWANPRNNGEVWASISTTDVQIDFENPMNSKTTFFTCECRFADDGEGTIPADKLQQLPTGSMSSFPVPGGIPGMDTSTLDISRIEWETFEAEGLDYGFGLISSGESGSVSLQ